MRAGPDRDMRLAEYESIRAHLLSLPCFTSSRSTSCRRHATALVAAVARRTTEPHQRTAAAAEAATAALMRWVPRRL